MSQIDPKDLIKGGYYMAQPLTKGKDAPYHIVEFSRMLEAGDPKLIISIPIDSSIIPFTAFYDRLKPIPITPEWLENLGFTPYADGTHALVEVDDEPYMIVKVMPISEKEPPLYSLEFQDKDGRLFSVYASCVHELQIKVWVLEQVWLSIEKEVSRV